MMVLFIDTETTGLVQPTLPEDHPAQPHLVQLGLILADDSGAAWATVELIVRPDGYTIPEAASRVHGVTTEMAKAVGIPLMVAVAAFTNLRALADCVVAHNYPFDDLVMRAAIARTGRKPAHPGPMKSICTMELAKPLMNLPPSQRMIAAGMDGPKPPSLMEAHKHFFGEEFAGAHGALADATACMRVYYAIQKEIAS